MRHRSSRQSRAKNFDKETRMEIAERDKGCIFCRAGRWPGGDSFEKSIPDTVHIVNKSQGGLGIVTNGVQGCRYHHHLLDNGSKGLRQELLTYAKSYLKEIYPGWSEGQQLYRKYDF